MLSFPPAILFFLGAALLAAVPQRARPAVFLAVPAIAFAVLLGLEPGTEVSLPFLNMELTPLRVDRLSLIFGYIFTLITFIGGIYALHLKDTEQQIAALLYGGSALGVVFAGDLLTLFVFWEIMAVASVGLIWARRTPESFRSGIRYLFVHIAGGGLLLAGVIWHYSTTGSIAFGAIGSGVPGWLILLAFAVNAAIPPLHAWMADSYPEGTVTGSVFLSAFTSKAAIYALARGFPGWEILIVAGAVMALYGAVYALLANDIRRILAYSIISQLGYMVASIGIGTEAALNGAAAHAFNHILYKSLLFMATGAVLYATGRSKLSELGGLARAMPAALILYMVGALSIAGLPLFNGYISKGLVTHGAELAGQSLLVMILYAASVGTLLHTGLRLPWYTWFGPQRQLEVGPTPRGMYIGMAAAAGLCFLIGVYPSLLYGILPYAEDYHAYTLSHVWSSVQLAVFGGLAFWLLMPLLRGRPTIALDTDWFYRRPAAYVYGLLGQIERAFGAAEHGALGVVHGVVRFGSDPVLCTVLAWRWLEQYFTALGSRERGISKERPLDLPLGIGVLVIIAAFVVLIAGFMLRI